MARKHKEETKQVFEGRASRSFATVRYDLAPPEAEEALARRLALGATKHGPNNWKQGGKEFIQATVNHMYLHLNRLKRQGNKNDSNTDALMANAAFLSHFAAVKPKEFEEALKEMR